MDRVLLAVQHSQFADWLSQGIYPVILTLHSVGLALLVGLIVIIDLRVLGWGAVLPIPALRRFMGVVWIGFWTNAFTGTLLFLIAPDKLFHSTLFRFKLAFIAGGLILGALLNSSLLSKGDEYGTNASAPNLREKALAALSLTCWIAAIFVGRWLAYTTFGDIGLEEG
jgi:hypothetical protein